MSPRALVQPLIAGGAGALIGFFGAFAVLLAGLTAAGASAEQAASGLLALCLVQGIASILLSARTRLPIAIVWSTPGAALLVAAHSTTNRFGVAVAAFLVSAALVVLTGALPALGAVLDRIPIALSGALLAGILFPFCLAPVRAATTEPLLALPLIVVWLALHRLAPRFAGAAVLVLAIVLTLATGGGGAHLTAPALVFTAPVFAPAAVIALAIPLWVVTMAGQNLPGLAVLRANGYTPPTRGLLVAGGLASAAAAPFGGNAVNLAAITGAIVAGPDAGDRSRRWIAGVASGVAYLVLALAAGPAAALVGSDPPVLIQAGAGLALLGAFIGGLTSAFEAAATRVAAAVTFLVVASGIQVLGIGGAFWGLVAGGVALLVTTRRAPRNP